MYTDRPIPLKPQGCSCISRPTREGDRLWPSCTWIIKIRSSCSEHFERYSARDRLTIMLRELQQGE